MRKKLTLLLLLGLIGPFTVTSLNQNFKTYAMESLDESQALPPPTPIEQPHIEEDVNKSKDYISLYLKILNKMLEIKTDSKDELNLLKKNLNNCCEEIKNTAEKSIKLINDNKSSINDGRYFENCN